MKNNTEGEVRLERKVRPPDGEWFFKERNCWWRIVKVHAGEAMDHFGMKPVELFKGKWTTFSDRERAECDNIGVYRRVDKTRDPFEEVGDTTV